jgi:putative ABC transport system permease protein
MNIINKLTLRHMKRNRRRTLVIIIGVIISVAMIMAVATISLSFLDMMKRQAIAYDGEWHVMYKDVNKRQLKAVKDDEATKTVVISRDRGYAVLEGSQNKNKPYLFIKEYNTEGFEKFPIELSKGRLPQATGEVVISEEVAENTKVVYEMGDTITLNIGQRIWTEGEGREEPLLQDTPLQSADDETNEILIGEQTKTYTVVGYIKRPIWEPAWAPGYTIIGYVDEGGIDQDGTVDAFVVLNKIQSSLYAHAEDLAKNNKIETVKFNNGLLRFYGVTDNDNLRTTFFSLAAIIMGIIVVGSISLIYNAFAISVSERSRHLGMLSSVGATKIQKRNSVFFEGAVIALISIPIGIFAGIGGIGITFWCINPMIHGALGGTKKLTVSVTPLSILVACIVSMITIFISVYIPAQKASKISAIDAIRQTTDIKLMGKAVKTSRIIRRIFGIEAEIALKNLKRNKRRYQAIVFSLVISIVLFLAVSFFTANLRKSIVLSQDGVNFDIYVLIGSEYTKTDERMVKAIASFDDVTKYSVVKKFMVNSWLDQKFITRELQEQAIEDKSILEDGKYPHSIHLHALDRESLKEYVKLVGADYESLINTEDITGIVIDSVKYEDAATGKFVETKAIHAQIGQTIDLYHNDQEPRQDAYMGKIKIAAFTDQLPMGFFPGGVAKLNIIISEQSMERLINEHKVDVNTTLFLRTANPMKTQHEIENIIENDMYVYNVYQSRQREEQMILIMSIFTYGFIVLITAISIANIFNTISTGILLRKREFAMLKSVGMTPKGFKKMINYESIFYGVKALLYGLPISIAVMYLIHRALMHTFQYGFTLPWVSIVYVIIAVFVIVGSAMLYSSAKVKKENIIDGLKQENI